MASIILQREMEGTYNPNSTFQRIDPGNPTGHELTQSQVIRRQSERSGRQTISDFAVEKACIITVHSCKIAADSSPSEIVQLWVRCGREAGYIPVVPHVRKRLRVSDVIGVVEREKRTIRIS